MTEHNWKPGDVAETTYNRTISRAFVVEDNRFCLPGHDRGMHWHGRSGGWNPIDDHAVTFRPLVVIDPESMEDVERLTNALDQFITSGDDYADGVQAALREFAAPTPPKPDEPQGLGAVVEDADGVRWVNVFEKGMWQDHRDRSQWREYREIAAVRVLSEGVS